MDPHIFKAASHTAFNASATEDVRKGTHIHCSANKPECRCQSAPVWTRWGGARSGSRRTACYLLQPQMRDRHCAVDGDDVGRLALDQTKLGQIELRMPDRMWLAAPHVGRSPLASGRPEVLRLCRQKGGLLSSSARQKSSCDTFGASSWRVLTS
ncbi:MAG: hypothetical protein ACJAVR_002071 [Paracoccaceae bacterium]|jgi:hypothetical protein